ncbi:hypothetical protein [Hyphococcus lacteus]|uniref:Uncharacterized protein n=1 Tax=Hyphococcus lacteus TaxID=3143536 RepID=A0ABV3Z248_9PROT
MHLTIRMNIQNTGNSPAANVTIFAEACFEDHVEPDGVYRFKAEKLEVDEVGGKISYPRELNIMEFDIGKLDPLLDNQGNIGIHGRIEYRHVFMSSQDEPIVTTFALSGLIDEKRAKWSKNIVVTPLNTCSHTRWKKNNNTT